ncbi:hypothetical protein ACKW9G_004995, partial [Escherichia coli]
KSSHGQKLPGGSPCGVRAFVILPWAVNNCAEIDAVNKALKDNSSLHDLEMATVHTGDGSAFPNCRNCQEIFKYLGINVLTG